jgi:hypothetical protein
MPTRARQLTMLFLPLFCVASELNSPCRRHLKMPRTRANVHVHVRRRGGGGGGALTAIRDG